MTSIFRSYSKVIPLDKRVHWLCSVLSSLPSTEKDQHPHIERFINSHNRKRENSHRVTLVRRMCVLVRWYSVLFSLARYKFPSKTIIIQCHFLLTKYAPIYSVDLHWIRRRHRFIDARNCVRYKPNGRTNTANTSTDGMNEIKYPDRYNHEWRDTSIQPQSREMTSRGSDRMTRTTGLIRSCLCSLSCRRNCSLYLCPPWDADRWRTVPKIMNKAENRFATKGPKKWKKRMKVL